MPFLLLSSITQNHIIWIDFRWVLATVKEVTDIWGIPAGCNGFCLMLATVHCVLIVVNLTMFPLSGGQEKK